MPQGSIGVPECDAYVAYASEISETPPRKSITAKSETLSRESVWHGLAGRSRSRGSHDVLLVRRDAAVAGALFDPEWVVTTDRDPRARSTNGRASQS